MAEHQSGVRPCSTCDQHPSIREDIVRAAKDLEHVCSKLNSQCDSIENIWKEVDKRLKIRPFYVLISVLITVLVFMLAMQLQTYATIGEINKQVEIVKYEIKSDLARHEGESSQLIKRVDEVTQEQKVLMDLVFQHMVTYPINGDRNIKGKKK